MIFCKIGTAVWITTSTVAMVQTGGYPRKPFARNCRCSTRSPVRSSAIEYAPNRTDALGKPSVFRAFVQRGKQQED
jgi:hypothetical protein